MNGRLAIACLLAVSGAAVAQLPEPRLISIFPLGGQAGQPLEMTVHGQDLEGADRLIFSHPGITAQPVASAADEFYPRARPVGNRFIVAIAHDVPPGVYEVRVGGPLGVSNARRLAVGTRPQIDEAEPNDSPAQAQPLAIDTIVNGRCEPRGYDNFRFAAAAGQRLILQCVSQRLNSQAQAAMILTDDSGRELARSSAAQGGDAIIDFTPPAAGNYIVKVYDYLFTGGESHGYRLIVSTGAWIEYTDPPVATAGVAGQLAVYGRNLPGGRPVADASVEGLQRVDLQFTPPAPGQQFVPGVMPPAAAVASHVPLVLPGVIEAGWVVLAPSAPTVEHEPNDAPGQPQPVTPPVEVAGRFNPIGDTDWITFQATKGQQLAIELFSHRLGLPTDPFFVVQQLKPDAAGQPVGHDLAEVDDVAGWTADKNSVLYRYPRHHSDPAMLFTAPEDGAYRLMVRNLYFSSQGDPRHIYRLAMRPPAPEFHLVAYPYQSTLVQPRKDVDLVPASVQLHRGGTTPVFVHMFRSPGFDGAVTLEAENLPPGVSAEPVVIPGWRSHGVLILKTAPDAPAAAAPLHIIGRHTSADGIQTQRQASAAETLIDAAGNRPVQTQLVSSLYTSIVEDFTSPLAIDIGSPQVHPSARGTKLQIPIKLIKTGEFKGDLNLAAIDQPPSVKIANIVLNASQLEQTLTIDIEAGAPLGTFSFYLHGVAAVPHARNARALKLAQEDKERIDKLIQERQAAVAQAEQALKVAQDGVAAAEAAQAPTAAAAVQQATEAQQRAQAALKATEEASKQAQAEVSRLSASAAPRDLTIAFTSPAITVNIVDAAQP